MGIKLAQIIRNVNHTSRHPGKPITAKVVNRKRPLPTDRRHHQVKHAPPADNNIKANLETELVPKSSGRIFTKKFTISILTYCAVDHAKRCVESVLATTNPLDTEIILTANGNKEATKLFDKFAQNNEHIKVVVNQDNLGFIEPNKRAFEAAQGEYFVMLNDDCVVEAGWLHGLQDPFLKYPNTAAISGPEDNASALKPSLNGFRTKGKIGFEYILLRKMSKIIPVSSIEKNCSSS